MLKDSIAKINELVFEPTAKPVLRSMFIIWPDEGYFLPIHSDDRDFLMDLWFYRGYLHLEYLPKEPCSEGLISAYSSAVPHLEYYRAAWQYALQIIPNWPGFQRLTLNIEEVEYLIQ